MSFPKALTIGLFAFASTSMADWKLSEYATVAPTAAMTDSVYGIQSFSNPGSTVTVSVPGGYVSLMASKIGDDPAASPKGNGYTANIGLLHPLTDDWKEHDLTGLTAITFEHQNTNKITDYLAVSFGSASYDSLHALAGTVYEVGFTGVKALAAHAVGEWVHDTALIGDFATPTWWTAPKSYPSIDSVLKRVKNLQFAPKSTYTGAGTQGAAACTKCTLPTMTQQTLNIRNITLIGVPAPGHGDLGWPNPTMEGCPTTGPSVTLSQFSGGTTLSAAKAYFFAFSDFDTLGTSTSPASGKTTVTDTVMEAATEAEAWMEMHAKLNKKDGGVYHKYAGWADLGTNFGTCHLFNGIDLTGIGFDLGNLGINVDRIRTIDFKVKMDGINDTAIHFVSFPVADLGAPRKFVKRGCVRLSDLKQASYVTTPTVFDPSKITQLSWEAKITDSKDLTIDTASANLLLGNIVFYGINTIFGEGCHGSVKGRMGLAPNSYAAYGNGVLRLSGFDEVKTFDVTTLDGKTVTSFAAAPRVALSLPRGTYFLRAKGGGQQAKFVVLGR